MKDMNVAKLTAADLPLFNGITADLFPGIDVPLLDYGIVCENLKLMFLCVCLHTRYVFAIATLQMKDAIEKELKAANLQNIDITVTKIIQLYETKNSRCVNIRRSNVL